MVHNVPATIIETRRISAHRDGNPRYEVTTEQGVWKTTPGGTVGYGISNSEYQGPVILTIDHGLIVGVATPDGHHHTGRLE